MRVVIAEDEALMRSGLALVLARGGIDVVGDAGSADDLITVAAELEPDVVITDIRMPPTHTDDGLRAALAIQARQPHVGVMVLSQHLQRQYALELVTDRPGGVGYLLKQRVADTEEFCRDVRRVADGETVLDQEVVAVMLDRARRERRQWNCSPRDSARCSASSPRGEATPPSPAACSSPRKRSCDTSRTSTTNSAYRSATTATDEFWLSSAISRAEPVLSACAESRPLTEIE